MMTGKEEIEAKNYYACQPAPCRVNRCQKPEYGIAGIRIERA